MKRIQLKQLIACALTTGTLLCAGTISAKAITNNDMQKATEKHFSVASSEQAVSDTWEKAANKEIKAREDGFKDLQKEANAQSDELLNSEKNLQSIRESYYINENKIMTANKIKATNDQKNAIKSESNTILNNEKASQNAWEKAANKEIKAREDGFKDLQKEAKTQSDELLNSEKNLEDARESYYKNQDKAIKDETNAVKSENDTILNNEKAFEDAWEKAANKEIKVNQLNNTISDFYNTDSIEALQNAEKNYNDKVIEVVSKEVAKKDLAKIKNAKSESDSILRKVENKIKNSNVANTNEAQSEEIVKIAKEALNKAKDYKDLVNEYSNADKVMISDALTNIRSAFEQLNNANKLKSDVVTLRNKISDSKSDTFKALKASKKALQGLNVKSSNEIYTNALKLAQVSRDKVIAYHDLIANSKITDKHIIASKDDAVETMRTQIEFITKIAQEKTLCSNINDANEALKISEKSISELKNISDPINSPEKMTAIIQTVNESRNKIVACQEFANSNKISNEEILKDLDSTVKTLEKQIETLNKFVEDAKKVYNNNTQI